MTTLLLFRHGEIEQSEPRRFVGGRDLPLTERGRGQARLWAPLLAKTPISAAWCSPLSRCRETAALALAQTSLAATPLDALREISLGRWEGRSAEEVRQRYPERFAQRGADIAHVAPEEGESFLQCQQRVWSALEGILAQASGTFAVFAHAGVNRALICRAMDLPLARVFSLGQDYAALNILRLDATAPATLLALNLPAAGAGAALASLSASF